VVPFIVYDCTIENLIERSAQAKHLSSAKAVQSYIGIDRNIIAQFTSKEAILNKKRYFSKKLNRHFAIRIDTKAINKLISDSE